MATCGDCKYFRVLPPMGPGYPPYDCSIKLFHATWYDTTACEDFEYKESYTPKSHKDSFLWNPWGVIWNTIKYIFKKW